MDDLFCATLGASMLEGFQNCAGLFEDVMAIAFGGNATEWVATRDWSDVVDPFVQGGERGASEEGADFLDDVTGCD